MDWIKVSEQLPPDNMVVQTKIEDENGCRNQQDLKRIGDLWYVPDGKMYVYYKPTHWMYLSELQKILTEMPIPKYQPLSFEKMSMNFGCGMEEPKEKRDCYFYHSEPDMGSHIDVCNYHGKLGYCPCENCDKYIKRTEVFEIVKEHIKKRESNEHT